MMRVPPCPCDECRRKSRVRVTWLGGPMHIPDWACSPPAPIVRVEDEIIVEAGPRDRVQVEVGQRARNDMIESRFNIILRKVWGSALA